MSGPPRHVVEHARGPDIQVTASWRSSLHEKCLNPMSISESLHLDLQTTRPKMPNAKPPQAFAFSWRITWNSESLTTTSCTLCLKSPPHTMRFHHGGWGRRRKQQMVRWFCFETGPISSFSKVQRENPKENPKVPSSPNKQENTYLWSIMIIFKLFAFSLPGLICFWWIAPRTSFQIHPSASHVASFWSFECNPSRTSTW